MNKFKILFLCLILFLVVGCKTQQEKAIEKFGITEEGFTCNYIFQYGPTYLDLQYEGADIVPIPDLEIPYPVSTSKVAIKVNKRVPSENDGEFEKTNPIEISMSVDGGNFNQYYLSYMDIENIGHTIPFQAYGKDFHLSFDDKFLEQFMDAYALNGMCLDNLMACRETQYISYRHDLSSYYKIYSKGQLDVCYWGVSITGDRGSSEKKFFNAEDMEKSKEYCVLTLGGGKKGRDDRFYSQVKLMRSKIGAYETGKSSNFLQVDISADRNCGVVSQRTATDGVPYRIFDGQEFTSEHFLYRNKNYLLTIPEDQVAKLFPTDGSFPSRIYVCQLKKTFGGVSGLQIYVDEQKGDEDCQKSRETLIGIEKGYESGRSSNLRTPPNCQGIFGSLTKEIQALFNIMKIAAPILILVLTTFDFVKATILQDKDESKVAFNKLIKRLLLAAILFFLPTLINLLLNWAGWSQVNYDPVCNIR